MIRYWKLEHVILTSVLGPPELLAIALVRDGNGVAANKAVLGTARPPVGATHYRDSVNEPWRPVAELS